MENYDSKDWYNRNRFEICWDFWNLCQAHSLPSWNGLTKNSSVSKSHKDRRILYGVHSMHKSPLFMWTLFTGKWGLSVLWHYTLNHYIVNLIAVVYTAEVCYTENMKLWGSKNVLSVIAKLSIVLTFFKLSKLFAKDCTRTILYTYIIIIGRGCQESTQVFKFCTKEGLRIVNMRPAQELLVGSLT